MKRFRPWARKRLAQMTRNRRDPLSLEILDVSNLKASSFDEESPEGIDLIMELQDLLFDLSGENGVFLMPTLCPGCQECIHYGPLYKECDYCEDTIDLLCRDCADSAYLTCSTCAEYDFFDAPVACLSCAAPDYCPHGSAWNCSNCMDHDPGCDLCFRDRYPNISDSE